MKAEMGSEVGEVPAGLLESPLAAGLAQDVDFLDLIGPYLPVLKRFALRLARNVHDSEDLFQDVLAKLFEHRERVATVKLLQPWLMRVMYHHFIDLCRRTSPLTGAASLHELSEFEDGCGLSEESFVTESHEVPDQVVQRMQLADAVSLAIGQLPTQQRAMVRLHDIEGASLPEVAQRMGISVNTVKSGLSRARDRLRASLHALEGSQMKRASRRGVDAAASLPRVAAS